MDENKKLSEEQLGEVAGGFLTGSVCFFTPTGETRTYETGNLWAKCASRCLAYVPETYYCNCHGKANCVDKWHQLNGDGELYPREHANHANKPKSNNYNT